MDLTLTFIPQQDVLGKSHLEKLESSIEGQRTTSSVRQEVPGGEVGGIAESGGPEGRGQGSAKASSCRVAELISQLRAQVASLQVEREAARDANRQLSTSASTLLLQLNLRGLSSPWGPVEEQPRKNQKQSPPTRNSHHGVRRSSLNAFQHGNCL